MNEDKLNNLVGSVLNDLGGAFSVPLVQIGERLGIYEALDSSGPSTSAELAESTGLAERYLREWLCAQAASKYVSYDSETSRFSLSQEQAFVFANRESPFYLAPAFGAASAFQDNEPRVRDAFVSGEGVSWGEQSQCLSCAVARFFRPGYQNHLVQNWLPSMDGMVERLTRGAQVADIGCGHGITTVIMAQAFPNSEFVGLDFHDRSIMEARRHAAKHDLPNLRFDVSHAKEMHGNYDLVTMFDCLHDMGDPIGGMKHVRETLNPGGCCMIVEPMASDDTVNNLNPIGRMYYCASTMVCVPTSLSQETGKALGAQAGEKQLCDVIVNKAGFRRCRRIAETPFNMVLEATA